MRGSFWTSPALPVASALTLLATVAPPPASAAQACRLQPVAELPVTLHGERRLRPVVAATVNGEPAQFIFDTGAWRTLVMTASTARLGLAPRPLAAGEQMTSFGQPVQAQDATAGRFDLGGRSRAGVALTVVDSDFGPGIDGLLGETEYAGDDVEFDLAEGVIRLFRPTDCPGADRPYWAMPGQAVARVALEPAAQSSRPFGWVTVNGVRLRAMFDSGTPTTALTAVAAARAGVTAQSPGVAMVGESRGVGPALLRTWVGPFRRLDIGGEAQDDLQLAFIDKPNASADLLIGADYFVTHRILLLRSQNLLLATPVGDGRLAAQPPR